MTVAEVKPGQVFSPIKESSFGRGEFIKLSYGKNNVVSVVSWIVGHISLDTEVEVLGKLSLVEIE